MKEPVHRNYEKRYGQKSKEADSGGKSGKESGQHHVRKNTEVKKGRVQQALENEEMMTGEGCPEFLQFCGVEYGST